MTTSKSIAGHAVTVRGLSLRAAPTRVLAELAGVAGASVDLEHLARWRRSRLTGRPDRGRPRGLSAGRVLVPILGLGLLVAGIVIGTQRNARAWTVSEVTQELRTIALAGGIADSPVAGSLGPLRLATRTIDAASGDFLDFRIESARMIVTARRAVLTVDAAKDTFAFDLHDVVFTRIPEMQDDGGSVAVPTPVTPPGAFALAAPVDPASFVHTTERHLFGPASFGQDIVPDGTARRGIGATAGRGGGFGPRGAAANDAPNTDWLRDAGSN